MMGHQNNGLARYILVSLTLLYDSIIWSFPFWILSFDIPLTFEL